MTVEDRTQTELVCAVDLGGTNLRAANIDREGQIHERIKTPTPKSATAQMIVKAIAEVVEQCEARSMERGALVQAISIVVPGSVQVGTGIVLNAPNIPSLQGFELARRLEDELSRPALLENDANAAAIGEMWQGAAQGYKTTICLTLGTGVGGGIVLDGELWRGVDGTAGEIGHTTVEPFGGVRCKCGSTGCLEVYASATAIVRMAREALVKDRRSPLHAISDDDLSSEKVDDAARRGDQLALEVFRKMGTYLGIAMANIVNIFNPEAIVVAGGAAAAWESFAGYARAEVLSRAFPVPAQRCRILKGACGDDAGLLGAARLALSRKADSRRQ